MNALQSIVLEALTRAFVDVLTDRLGRAPLDSELRQLAQTFGADAARSIATQTAADAEPENPRGQ